MKDFTTMFPIKLFTGWYMVVIIHTDLIFQFDTSDDLINLYLFRQHNCCHFSQCCC